MYEFRAGGEMNRRPDGSVSSREWAHYLYMRNNVAGEQTEWWFHRLGCRRWLIGVRDTRTNTVIELRDANRPAA